MNLAKQSSKSPPGFAPLTIQVAVKRAPLVSVEDGWVSMEWPHVNRELTVSVPASTIPRMIADLQAAQAEKATA